MRLSPTCSTSLTLPGSLELRLRQEFRCHREWARLAIPRRCSRPIQVSHHGSSMCLATDKCQGTTLSRAVHAYKSWASALEKECGCSGLQQSALRGALVQAAAAATLALPCPRSPRRTGWLPY